MRRRFKQDTTLQERLDAFTREMLERAAKAPAGPERDKLLKRARRTEVANHLEDWANSPGLQPPK